MGLSLTRKISRSRLESYPRSWGNPRLDKEVKYYCNTGEGPGGLKACCKHSVCRRRLRAGAQHPRRMNIKPQVQIKERVGNQRPPTGAASDSVHCLSLSPQLTERGPSAQSRFSHSPKGKARRILPLSVEILSRSDSRSSSWLWQQGIGIFRGYPGTDFCKGHGLGGKGRVDFLM